MSPDPGLLAALLGLVAARVPGRLFVLGLCGAQGSGKSTLASALVDTLARQGVRAATLSLDDLYLTRAAREDLGVKVHPLFATRGVPGTHDVALGRDLLERLDRGEGAALPRFDKARDDRAPPKAWPEVEPGLEVLVFEGWCVGARPQDGAALAHPVNALERDEDPDGRWRRQVNASLSGAYQQLFARIDALALLAAPSFDVVAGWRLEQEQALGSAARMDRDAIARFVQFYERITRHILAEMPGRADLVARLSPNRIPLEIIRRERPSHR